VCISHAEGAAGEEVGRLVADRLGFVYVDEEIVARAAARGGIDPADVADEERRKSLLERVLVGLAQGGSEAWAGFVPPRGVADPLRPRRQHGCRLCRASGRIDLPGCNGVATAKAEQAIEGHMLTTAELVGTYERWPAHKHPSARVQIQRAKRWR
jgi:hypothetical protein